MSDTNSVQIVKPENDFDRNYQVALIITARHILRRPDEELNARFREWLGKELDDWTLFSRIKRGEWRGLRDAEYWLKCNPGKTMDDLVKQIIVDAKKLNDLALAIAESESNRLAAVYSKREKEVHANT